MIFLHKMEPENTNNAELTTKSKYNIDALVHYNDEWVPVSGLNEKRIKALVRGNYGLFSGLCNALGVEPEDVNAYELGLMSPSYEPINLTEVDEELYILKQEKKQESARQRIMHSKHYINGNLLKILESAESKGLNVSDVKADPIAKRNDLQSILRYKSLRCTRDKRYPSGRKPINKAEPEMIGEVYKKWFDKAKLVYRQ